MTTVVSLQVTYDRAVAPQSSLTFGAGWARARLHTPPLPDWKPGGESAVETLMQLLSLQIQLRGESTKLSTLDSSVCLDGFDCPVGDGHAALLAQIRETWRATAASAEARRAQRGPIAPASPQLPGSAPPARWSLEPGPAILAAPPDARGPSYTPPVAAPRVLLQSAPPAVGQSPNDRLVETMVRTIRQYRATYGAAPNFSDNKASVREKAYNYIRSTAAQPTASEQVVEAVRRRLAAEEA